MDVDVQGGQSFELGLLMGLAGLPIASLVISLVLLLFFKTPAAESLRFVICGRDSQSRDDEKGTGWIASGEGSLEFVAPVTEPITPTDGRLLITAASQRGRSVEASLSYDAARRTLRGRFNLPATSRAAQYQVRYCYTDSVTGYVYMKEDVQGFVASGEAPQLPTATDAGVLLAGEFSHLETADLKDMIWLGGACAGPLGWAEPRGGSTAPRPGGLDAQWFDRIWFLPSDHLNRALCRGIQIHIEAKMTGNFSGDPYCALLTKGDFHTGFRILVGKDKRLLFQLAGLDSKTGGPLSVSTPPGAVPLDRWIDIDLIYAPPTDDQAGRVEIKIDGQRLTTRPVAKPMPVSAAVVGIGCEFGTPLKGPFGKRRPNFPGLIRKVSIRDSESARDPIGQ